MSTLSAAPHAPSVTVPHHVHRHWRTAVASALLAVALVAVGATALEWWAAPQPVGAASVERVSEEIALAAAAEEAYFEEHGSYTAVTERLAPFGWTSVSDVTVTIVSVGSGRFCLSAGPAGGEPTAWLTQEWGTPTEPCQ